ncbi:hypothetical protein COCSADRAFT_241827 [Bipolaris sorokiniana ND90Pr]|uniref:Uncharacterized protein n=1 Tax=Cochliobolus sativus (strain ND90Pr / ATCC 201652) TaxID=665912 RepID=M2STC7_COCSN|nr:uncharacterized protein COCSADRAFT_241827 [Bipolaris sorokiniana ND90Pr]EMD60346.1 hypothetical protein COCSADRAFT_241827 [Bipolaris sorokiniana ND90Pr]
MVAEKALVGTSTVATWRSGVQSTFSLSITIHILCPRFKPSQRYSRYMAFPFGDLGGNGFLKLTLYITVTDASTCARLCKSKKGISGCRTIYPRSAARGRTM